jgi:hypothetical protein
MVASASNQSIWLRHAADRVSIVLVFPLRLLLLAPGNRSFLCRTPQIQEAVALHPCRTRRCCIGRRALYHVLPACGPLYLLGTDGFAGDCGTSCSNIALMTINNSWKSWLYNSSLFDERLPRNAMPSLHVTWALLIFWICRDLRWGRWIAGAFLLCTVLSTMVCGAVAPVLTWNTCTRAFTTSAT